MRIRKGFTAIEIVIVLALVAIVGGIYFVSKNKSSADVATGAYVVDSNTSVKELGFCTDWTTGNIYCLKGEVSLADSSGRNVTSGYDVIFNFYKQGPDNKLVSIGSTSAGLGQWGDAYVYHFPTIPVNNTDTYYMSASAKNKSTGQLTPIYRSYTWSDTQPYYYTYAIATNKIQKVTQVPGTRTLKFTYNNGLPAKAYLMYYSFKENQGYKIVDVTGKTEYTLPADATTGLYDSTLSVYAAAGYIIDAHGGNFTIN